MHASDFESFRGILDRCADVFGKPKPADELVQSYWHALKDQTIGTVKECSERHARYGKFFPKPFELRPRDEGPKNTSAEDAAKEAAFRAARARCMEGWNLMLKDDPAKFRAKWIEARAARMEILTGRASLVELEVEADQIIEAGKV